MVVLEIVFWVSVGLIVYAHVGYPLLLCGAEPAVRRRRSDAGAEAPAAEPASG